jgi:hypothetical protein
MQLEVTDNKKILDLKEDFNRIFPFLKLEFYTIVDNDALTVQKCIPIRNNMKSIGDYKKNAISRNKFFTGEQSVTDLEKFFRAHYHLTVQVFRKSGRAWLETSATGDWPLAKQNKEGELLSRNL